jgi:hypothetical protein
MATAAYGRRTPARSGAGGSGGRAGRIVLAGIAFLLAVIGWGAYAGWFTPTPKELRQVRAMVDQKVVEYARMGRGEVPYDPTADDIRPMFESMRDMPESVRAQVGPEIGRFFNAREGAEVNSFFNLPPEQRKAELDRRIKAEEARRKAWEAERAARGDGGGGPGGRGGPRGGPPGGPPGGQAGGGAPGGGAGRGGPGGRRGSEADRNAWVKRRIDSTSPEERAKRTEYRRLRDERRQQLGLSPGWGR